MRSCLRRISCLYKLIRRTAIKTITYTSLSTYQDCQKKYYWSYIRKLMRIGPPGAKDLGTVLHTALETLFLTGKLEDALFSINKYKGQLSEEDFWRAKGIVAGYYRKWGNPKDRYEIRKVEKTFSIPIPGCDTTVEGRIDAVVVDRETGRVQLWDHKSTSRFDADYVIRRWMDLQLNIYAIGSEECFDLKIDEFVYDVMKKPEIRLKKNETMEQFADRCFAVSTPDQYERIVYPVEEMRVEETKRQLMGWLGQMEIAEMTGFYGENINRCGDYGGCPYWDACLSGGAPIVIDNGYKPKETH